MKKLSLLMFAVMAILGANAVIAESTAQKFTCVMHPEVVMDAPGECPKCGMTLVPVETEKKRPNSNEKKKKSAHGDHDIVEHEAERLKAENRPESHDQRPHQNMFWRGIGKLGCEKGFLFQLSGIPARPSQSNA